MNDVVLAAEPRLVSGSAACRRLRREGKTPAVLYGTAIDPQALVVDSRALRYALSGPAGLNVLLSIEVDGISHLALARQLQRGPLKGGIDHVDFLAVSRDAVVTADVPLRLVGEALELHRADGLLEQQLFSLPVKAKPADIPPHVDVDISGLLVGDTIRVGDLSPGEGVTVDLDPGDPVVSGVQARLEAEAEEAEVEGEIAAEEGAPEEGGAGEDSEPAGGQASPEG